MVIHTITEVDKDIFIAGILFSILCVMWIVLEGGTDAGLGKIRELDRLQKQEEQLQLIKCLSKEGRYQEVEKVLTDPKYRTELLKEYHII